MNRTFAVACFFAVTSLFVTGCGQSPQELCDHVLELEKAEGPKSMGRPACEMKIGFQKEKLGIFRYSTFSSCVSAAKTMDEVVACNPKN